MDNYFLCISYRNITQFYGRIILSFLRVKRIFLHFNTKKPSHFCAFGGALTCLHMQLLSLLPAFLSFCLTSPETNYLEPENDMQAGVSAPIILKQSQQTHKGKCPNVAQNSIEDPSVFWGVFCLSLQPVVTVNAALMQRSSCVFKAIH